MNKFDQSWRQINHPFQINKPSLSVLAQMRFLKVVIWWNRFERDIAKNPRVIATLSQDITRREGELHRLMIQG